jgi:5-methylcytosine-specific restriction endonuclease McrA
MRLKKVKLDKKRQAEIVTNATKAQGERASGYREKAINLFPHVCARCGREFAGESLKELTVHHKDQNHDNNPSDGSNWELLCVYCHDNEHQDLTDSGYSDGSTTERHSESPLGFNPFGALKDMDGKDNS